MLKLKRDASAVGGRPQFAAVPNRALWDRDLTDRDVRNLAVIAAHDRLSSARGTGQGAWASHKRFAALAGTEYSRFSVSVNRLLDRGYLGREPLATDRRKFTYRVIYTDEDSLPSSKELPPEIVCSDVNDDGEIVCSDPEPSDCDQTETDAQYISRREEIDSVETGKIDSEKQRTLNGASLGKTKFNDNIGARLAQFERAWKADPNAFADEQITEWYNWLFELSEDTDPQDPDNQRAQRLYYTVDADLYEANRGPYAAGQAA